MEKKIVLVTGVGFGIRRASSLALLEKGFHVVLVERQEAALRETAELDDGLKETAMLVVGVIRTRDR